MVGEVPGGKPACRLRGLRSEAESGMAGPGGSGWEEVVGEGKGRAGTSGRASKRAAATLTLIRRRVTKWRIGPQWPPPRSAAGKESLGLEGRGRRRPGRKCRKWPLKHEKVVLSLKFLGRFSGHFPGSLREEKSVIGLFCSSQHPVGNTRLLKTLLL